MKNPDISRLYVQHAAVMCSWTANVYSCEKIQMNICRHVFPCIYTCTDHDAHAHSDEEFGAKKKPAPKKAPAAKKAAPKKKADSDDDDVFADAVNALDVRDMYFRS